MTRHSFHPLAFAALLALTGAAQAEVGVESPILVTIEPAQTFADAVGTTPVTDASTVTTMEDPVIEPPILIATPVPEPGSWALMLAGLGALGLALRGRKAR